MALRESTVNKALRKQMNTMRSDCQTPAWPTT